MLPVSVCVFSFIEHLNTEPMIEKIFCEFLPGNLMADFAKVIRYGALVVCILVAFEVFALAFYHQHRSDGFLVVPLLDDEVWVDSGSLVALNRKMLRADQVSIPPKHLRVRVQI